MTSAPGSGAARASTDSFKEGSMSAYFDGPNATSTLLDLFEDLAGPHTNLSFVQVLSERPSMIKLVLRIMRVRSLR